MLSSPPRAMQTLWTCTRMHCSQVSDALILLGQNWPGNGPVEPGSWTNTSLKTASYKFTGVRKMTQRRSLEMCRVCWNGVYLVPQISNTNTWADPRTRIIALKLPPSYLNPFLIGVRHGLSVASPNGGLLWPHQFVWIHSYCVHKLPLKLTNNIKLCRQLTSD